MRIIPYNFYNRVKVKDEILKIQLVEELWPFKDTYNQNSDVSIQFFEAHLNNVQKFSSYIKQNTTRLHYKDQLVNVV
jgi:hypothetical protein